MWIYITKRHSGYLGDHLWCKYIYFHSLRVPLATCKTRKQIFFSLSMVLQNGPSIELRQTQQITSCNGSLLGPVLLNFEPKFPSKPNIFTRDPLVLTIYQRFQRPRAVLIKFLQSWRDGFRDTWCCKNSWIKGALWQLFSIPLFSSSSIVLTNFSCLLKNFANQFFTDRHLTVLIIKKPTLFFCLLQQGKQKTRERLCFRLFRMQHNMCCMRKTYL